MICVYYNISDLTFQYSRISLKRNNYDINTMKTSLSPFPLSEFGHLYHELH